MRNQVVKPVGVVGVPSVGGDQNYAFAVLERAHQNGAPPTAAAASDGRQHDDRQSAPATQQAAPGGGEDGTVQPRPHAENRVFGPPGHAASYGVEGRFHGRMVGPMRYLDVGGVHLSVIGLGTWQFGSREWGYGDDYAVREAVAITRRALDLGVSLIDTAEIYAFGGSERIVGRAVAGRRSDAFLATKLFPVLPIAPVVTWRGRRSALRLGVQRLDLYQVHAHNPVIPVSSTMRGMKQLQRRGLVDSVGVSNFTLEQWRAAEDALGGRVLSNQVRYSLAVRSPEQEILPWAQDTGHVVIAYSPLAQGLLGGSYDGSNTPKGYRARSALFRPDNVVRAAGLLTVLREVAAAHSATPAQVALAWLLRRPNVVAIPGARTVAQLEANAAAADLDITEDEDRELCEASDRFGAAAAGAVSNRPGR